MVRLMRMVDDFRINFKMLLFKSLNGSAPSYVADLLELCTPLRSLRSANRLLVAPKPRHETRGSRAFSVLPTHVKLAPTLETFKFRLKTLLVLCYVLQCILVFYVFQCLTVFSLLFCWFFRDFIIIFVFRLF